MHANAAELKFFTPSNYLAVVVDLAPLLGVLLAACVCLLFLGWAVLGGKTVKVSCWFCQKSSKVDKWSAYGWTCPHCEQYNGFTEDGDYNKIIPQQADDTHNHNSHAVRRTMKPQRTVLCTICTHNQALKMQHRSTFEPTSEATFDEEVERFNRRLEVAYRLCASCEAAVQDELAYQRREVVSANMKPIRAHNVVVPTRGFSLAEWIHPLRSIPLLASAVLFFYPVSTLLDSITISIWLLVYITVYISHSYARPRSFIPFVIMVCSSAVNGTHDLLDVCTYCKYNFKQCFIFIPPFCTIFNKGYGAVYKIYHAASASAHRIVYIGMLLAIRGTTPLLTQSQVAWRSSCIKPPKIQPKPPTNNTHTSTTTSNRTINSNATLHSGFGSFGLHDGSGMGFNGNSSSIPNRFSRSTAEHKPQQHMEDNFSLGELGVHSLDNMLSRIELSQTEPKQKPNSRLRYVSIGSFIMIILGGLLYFGFEVKSSIF